MNTFKSLLAVAFAISSAASAHAQVQLQSSLRNEIPYSKNEVGIEVGGNSLIYSAYYQRALYRKGNTQFNIRIGGALIPGFDNYNDNSYSRSNFTTGAYILPNILFFQKRHAWEIGLGLNMLSNFEKETDTYYSQQVTTYQHSTQIYFLVPQVGYRAYFKNSKFYMRVAVSTFFLFHWSDFDGYYQDVEPKVLPWGAFGFGYTFGKSQPQQRRP